MFYIEYVERINGIEINKVSPSFETIDECGDFVRKEITTNRKRYFQRFIIEK